MPLKDDWATGDEYTADDQNDTADAVNAKVDKNSAITGATRTKITYDAKGLVTAGAVATQDDFADGTTNKAYTATEKSKLATIASGADVTGSANVDTAGAVMNTDTTTAAMQFVQSTVDTTTTKVPTSSAVKTYVDSHGYLPSYVTVNRARTNPYNAIHNTYNWKPTNTRKLHACLGRAAVGGKGHIAVIGTSISSGYMGDASTPYYDPTKTWVRVMRSFIAAQGIPLGGTGVVFSGDEGQVPGDARWAVTSGSWGLPAAKLGYAYTAGTGNTMTFTTDIAATEIDVYYYGGGGAATVNINGAGAVALNITGGVVLKKYTVTGVFPVGSTVVVTTTNSTNFYLVGANATNAGGLDVHNLAVATTSTVDWTASISYTAGGLNDSHCGPLTLSSITPDVVFCEHNANDVIGGTSSATYKTNLTTLRTQFSSSDFVLVGCAAWSTLSEELFDVADTLDIPYYDTFSRYGGLASGQPGDVNGLVNDSLRVHPNKYLDADWGRSMGRLVTA